MARTIAAGMTPAQFYAAVNSIAKCYDVTDYGAVHDNSTDDTIAIQSALSACVTGGGGTVYFPAGIYKIAGAFQTNVGGTNMNSQLYIPTNDFDTNRVTIKLIGEEVPNMTQSATINNATESYVVPGTKGTILRSTQTTSTANSYVIASQGNSTSIYANFNYNNVWIENIQIQLAVDGNKKVSVGGIGCLEGSNNVIKNCTVFPWANTLVDGASPTNRCVGICLPAVNCEQSNIIENCSVGGLTSGFYMTDHAVLNDVYSFGCINGIEVGPNLLVATIIKAGCNYCQNQITFSGGLSTVNALCLNVENFTQNLWYDFAYGVVDTNNYGRGTINFFFNHGSVLDNAAFTKNGGTKLQCIPIAFLANTSFTVTGSKASNAALTSLIAALVAKGLIIDSTT